MRWFFRWLLGGRPMKRVGFAFTDRVSGRSVNYYRDRYGRYWMAEHGWALFRVRSNLTAETAPLVTLRDIGAL